jgi:hypothetical protein
MTLAEIIEQLEACGYECEAGRLENNVVWQRLKTWLMVEEVIRKVRKGDWPHSNEGSGPMHGVAAFIQGE